ncbi:MAG: uracil-xanthine permease family protein [archaeon]
MNLQKLNKVGENVVLSTQHAIAMFGATILIPMLMGLPPSLGLLSAGVGTLIYHFFTKKMIPIFLGSSATYLAVFLSIKESSSINAAVGSFVGAAFVYFVFGFIVKKIGHKTITKLLPETVAGAVIIVIGITLVPIALMLAETNYLLALIAALLMMFFSAIDYKLFNRAPLLFAMGTSYVVAYFMGLVDFSIVSQAPWFRMPEFITPSFEFNAIYMMAIVGVVSFLEHIGDLTTNGMIVGNNHFEKPGLYRSLFGQGTALLFSGLIGGTPTTTYGENNGVLAITKQFNPIYVRGAAIIAILLSFLGKFEALLSTIPMPVIGGISFILFGMIMMSGIASVKESTANVMEFRHAAVVFVPIFIGVASVLPNNPLQISLGNATLAGISLAAVVGILLNLLFNLIDKINGKVDN